MVLSFAVTLPEDMPKKKQRKGKGKTSSQSKLNAKGNRVSIPEECLEAPLFILKKLLRESASTNLIYCLQQQAGQGRKSYPSPNPPHSHTAGEHVQSRKHTHTHTHTHARTHAWICSHSMQRPWARCVNCGKRFKIWQGLSKHHNACIMKQQQGQQLVAGMFASHG